MERIPIISNAREELAEAVRSGQISPPSPIACSPWVAMSVMQKAIRRGRDDLALRTAATLLKGTPERLWRRCGVIAFEDIGVADLGARGRSLRRSAARRSERNSAASGRSPALASCMQTSRHSRPRSVHELAVH